MWTIISNRKINNVKLNIKEETKEKDKTKKKVCDYWLLKTVVCSMGKMELRPLDQNVFTAGKWF
ncbi:hypothetical protein T06_201 [Trichinella sp. T6]|nr:hypothetical protein T06_201 [Trichinella sp. T6]